MIRKKQNRSLKMDQLALSMLSEEALTELMSAYLLRQDIINAYHIGNAHSIGWRAFKLLRSFQSHPQLINTSFTNATLQIREEQRQTELEHQPKNTPGAAECHSPEDSSITPASIEPTTDQWILVAEECARYLKERHSMFNREHNADIVDIGANYLKHMGQTNATFTTHFLKLMGPEAMSDILFALSAPRSHPVRLPTTTAVFSQGLHHTLVRHLTPCLSSMDTAFFHSLLEADWVSQSLLTTHQEIIKDIEFLDGERQDGLSGLLRSSRPELFTQALQFLQMKNVDLVEVLNLHHPTQDRHCINSFYYCLQHRQWDMAHAILHFCPTIDATDLLDQFLEQRAEQKPPSWMEEGMPAERAAHLAQLEKIELMRHQLPLSCFKKGLVGLSFASSADSLDAPPSAATKLRI